MDFDPFCVSVFQGSFLEIVVLIDGVKAAFELSSSRVSRVSIRPVLETLYSDRGCHKYNRVKKPYTPTHRRQSLFMTKQRLLFSKALVSKFSGNPLGEVGEVS